MKTQRSSHAELKKRKKGFTLIELLVVVLIIGILVSIAIPQYFKIVERARVSEAHAFISQVKSAQERYLARTSVYVAGAQADTMDVTFPGNQSTNFGLRNYNVTWSVAACTSGPGYLLNLTRKAPTPSRYGGYAVSYNRCTGILNYPGCLTTGCTGSCCDQDFGQ